LGEERPSLAEKWDVRRDPLDHLRVPGQRDPDYPFSGSPTFEAEDACRERAIADAAVIPVLALGDIPLAEDAPVGAVGC
jgi:hypothetical protein